MRAAFNDAVRWLIARCIGAVGWALAIDLHRRIAGYRRHQGRLRRRLDISDDAPVLGYGPELEALVARRAAALGPAARFALTSGSSAAPKRLLYTPRRLRATKRAFVDAFARLCAGFGVRRRSLFVLSALADDGSLTAHLLSEPGSPSALALLQAPYRALSHPALRQLVREHGATAVRLFLITVANPGVLYATNPSTLSTFLDDVVADWTRATVLIRRFRSAPESLPADLPALVARLASRGWTRRLDEAAASPAPLPVWRWAPGLQAYLTWTGGYVAPFLERLRAHLPERRYRRIPMYSMSTETIETVPHVVSAGDAAFVPLGPGVLYEFLPLDEDAATDRAGRLLSPWALQPGARYTMVVSDGFGLRRYQTGDVFLCRRLVNGLPDLTFLRRRGLEHSFTGEKLTAQQAAAAFERARAQVPLPAGTHLALVPSWPAGEPIPHYQLVAIAGQRIGAEQLERLAERCQSALEEQNDEYRSKVASARLGPLRAEAIDPEGFARAVGGERHRDSWEAQFKFLPLYRARWERRPAAGPAR
jgi:hypothetical protein